MNKPSSSRLAVLTFRLVVLTLTVAVAGCAGGAGAKDDKGGGRPPVAVEVATATPADLVAAIDVVGTLQPKSAVAVKAESTAIIAEVYVTEWVKVTRGAPLARLDTRETEAVRAAARAATMQAEVAERRAEREMERTRQLKGYGLATQQMLDDAVSVRDAATATTQAARAQASVAETQFDKAIIRAPITGTVAFRGVSVGDRVENMGDGVLFRIVDLSVLQLTVTVPSSRSAEIALGQPLAFCVDSLPGRTFTGRIEHLNPSLEAGSRAVMIQVEVQNPSEELRAGLFAKGQIRTGERTGVLQIPRTALLSWDATARVGQLFVVDGDLARRREISTGNLSGDLIEVRTGLAAGDRVITRGGFVLRDGDHVVVSSSQPQGA